MDTVTKKDIIASIADDVKMHPNEVGNIIRKFLKKIIKHLLDGKRLEFRDFAIFEVVERKKKVGRNPKNPTVPISIPNRLIVKVKMGKAVTEQLRINEKEIRQKIQERASREEQKEGFKEEQRQREQSIPSLE